LRQKILIVDDAPQNIHVLMEALKDDYTLVAATTGTKALELASRQPRPDLILLDIVMPGIDGFEVCRRLKADPETATIPVVFITSLSESTNEESGLQLGALDFIVKPFQISLVKVRIKNQLELKRHRENLEAEVVKRTTELLAAQASNHRLEQELNIARKLQFSMLARDLLVLPGQDSGGIAAMLRPARAVGGDLYDHILLDSNRLLVVLGDVSDKGVAAALFMVRALTLIRAVAPYVTLPGELLEKVNRALCRDNDACMFVTLACCIMRLDTMEWSYSSGGHEPPLLLGDGPARYLELESGPALGLMPEAEFPVESGRLSPCSTILLYTDGVTEAEGALTQYGSERLIREAHRLAGREPREIVAGITDSVVEFVGNVEQSDDLTMLALQAPISSIQAVSFFDRRLLCEVA
jgi:phosphoserine phosphatase RsbU/P